MPIINEIVYPLPVSIVHSSVKKVKSIQEQKGYIKVKSLKQWKSKQIYEAIQANQHLAYKTFCEEHNTVQPTWEQEFAAFTLSVKGKPFADAEPLIKAFVENLRRIRHNQLCLKPDLIERDNRLIWPAQTVVRAFLEGKLDVFKAFTETSTNESPENPKWTDRWNTFVESLETHKADEGTLKNLCSKFMTAQRIKRYRLLLRKSK